MRLIRLTTQDNRGIFDNDFNSDILIKKGQQIALQSSSFHENVGQIVIGALNNDLTFEFDTNNTPLSITLDAQTYNSENHEDLVDDITIKLNNALVSPSGTSTTSKRLLIGLVFKAEIKNNKTEIGYRRSNYISSRSRVTEDEAEFVGMESSAASGNTYRSISSANVTDDSVKYYSLIPWSPFGGGCVFRTKIINYVDTGTGNADNGITFGLSEQNPVNWATDTTMSAEAKTYYIKFIREGTAYQTKIKGGTEGATGTLPNKCSGENPNTTENDYLEWRVNAGRLQGVLYRGAPHNDLVVLVDEPFPTGTYLYPFVTMQGGAVNVRMDSLNHSIDPYDDNSASLNSTIEDDDQTNGGTSLTSNPPIGARTPVRAFQNSNITMSADLSEYMGFDGITNILFSNNGESFTPTTDPNLIGSALVFTADHIFTGTLSNVNYLVELRNIQIESYNSESGNRENIIASINRHSGPAQGIIEYESNYPYFINIKENSLIRNLRARILRIDGSELDLIGVSVINLLIKDRDE